MLKLLDNPPMLPPSFSSIAEFRGQWWAAHTRSRFEKSFAFDLLAMNVPYYLPMVRRVIVSGGRKRRLLMPLFPSYVFFCGDDEARWLALGTQRLCQVLPVRDPSRFVKELGAVESAIRSDAALQVCSLPPVGRRCRVKAGPLKGVEGTVLSHNQRTLIVLHLSMLGRGASLEIEADLLEEAE